MRIETRYLTNTVQGIFGLICLLWVSVALPQGPHLPTIPGLEPLSPEEQRADAERKRQTDKLLQKWGPPDGMGGLVSGDEADFMIHSNSGASFAEIWKHYASKCGIKREFNPEDTSHIGSESLPDAQIATRGFKVSKIGDNVFATFFSIFPDSRAISIALMQNGKVTFISVTGFSITGPKRE
jgi:hypothetical protein